MKIELVRPVRGIAYFEGDVIEVPDEKGRALCESGHAIPAKDTLPPAKAIQPETAESSKPLSAETAQAVVRKRKR